MRALEEEFRHELFDRSGRTAVLNDYGKAIFPQVGQMLEGLKRCRVGVKRRG